MGPSCHHQPQPWRNDRPVPGMPTFIIEPRGPTVMLAPRGPNEAEMPLLEKLSRTPGKSVTRREKRNPKIPPPEGKKGVFESARIQKTRTPGSF